MSQILLKKTGITFEIEMYNSSPECKIIFSHVSLKLAASASKFHRIYKARFCSGFEK